MPGDKNSGGEQDIDRRTFLEWASAAGVISIAPDTIAKVAEAKHNREPVEPLPESEKGDPTSDVNVRHTLELPNVRERVDRFNTDGDPRVFFDDFLKEHLQRNPAKREFSIVVRTIGERNTIRTKGPFKRTVNGWRPTKREVDKLSQFGEVGFTSSYSGTTVSLRGISRDALVSIASLEFVLQMTWDAPLDLNSCCSGENSGINVDNVRSSDYTRFRLEDGDYSLPSYVSVGIIDTGYDSSMTAYSKGHAENIGLDTSLAKDFTPDDDWSKDTYSDSCSHGTAVADTTAYMLDDSACHSNTFVPLKMWKDRPDYDKVNDYLRQAIEYAGDHGINVINISSGMRNTTELTDYCTSQFCQELDTYANFGYYATSTSGNAGRPNKVQQPGGSWLTIGTGGVNQSSCSSGDYERHANSCYAPSYDYSNCDWCSTYESSGSCPTVYSAYTIETNADSDNVICGTSFAAPVAAAAAAIMASNTLYDYSTAREVFEDMTHHSVCPDEAAKTGQIVDAEYANRKTE